MFALIFSANAGEIDKLESKEFQKFPSISRKTRPTQIALNPRQGITSYSHAKLAEILTSRRLVEMFCFSSLLHLALGAYAPWRKTFSMATQQVDEWTPQNSPFIQFSALSTWHHKKKFARSERQRWFHEWETKVSLSSLWIMPRE